MSESQNCPRCGAGLPPGAPGGHCISCLLQLGLGPGDGADEPPGISAPAPVSEKPGDRIGRYKLLQQIGEGGCGVVYMAEQEEPVRRRVALKVIKLGMDTKQVIARFESERQALALMDHPNIAKVLDAGATETGRPYFVMELVRGIKITDYCDQQKLSTRHRLDLFIPVCQAVQHAHQKGIIHRDLKPSNVLVTEQDGKAVPKIIDFGIAKATTAAPLTDKTLFTAFEQFIGTPAYMSPEQAGLGGLDIDTRSDVYSLGVLLYELLTGKPPFDSAALRRSAIDEILRSIREQEPPRPSVRLTTLPEQELTMVAQRHQSEPAKFSNLIRGDLDWIVMKTLEKDRARRYATANGLAVDIQRHLKNEPVIARPPSSFYRAQKWARRNMLIFIASSLVVISLVAGLGISTWMYSKERVSHQRAEEQAHRALVAEGNTRDQLWNSQLAQARAERWSHRAGRRYESLALLRKAAEYRPSSVELRNEAIACLALPDLHIAKQWTSDVAGVSRSAFDGKFDRVAIGDEHGNVSLREIQSDHQLMLLSGFGARVNELYFSPDNQLLAVAYESKQHSLQIWDLVSQRVILEPAITNFRTLAFTSDGSRVAISQYKAPLVIYDLPTQRQVKSLAPAALPWGLAFDPTGLRLAVSSAGDTISSAEATNVFVWNLETEQVALSLAHPNVVRGVAWNAEGNRLVTACADGNIYMWNPASGALVRTLKGHESAVINLCFNHRGDLLASTSWDGQLRLWDAIAGIEICNWPVEQEQYEIEFSADGHWLSHHGSGMKQSIFEVAEGTACNFLRADIEESGIWSSTFSPDGQVLASTHRDGVRFWDAKTGRQIGFQSMGDTRCAIFDFSGKVLITSGSYGLKQWPIELSLEDSTNKLSIGAATDISTRPDENQIQRTLDQNPTTAALVSSGKIYLIDLVTRREQEPLAGHTPFDFASISANGRWCAASSSSSKVVEVFDLNHSNAVHVLLVGKQTTILAFSPDNRWLATGGFEEYKFWNTATWQCLSSVRREATGGLGGEVVFSPDSQIAAVEYSSQLVRLLDPATGLELATLESSAPQNISWLAFSKDGNQLAVPGWNQMNQLWDLRLLRQELAAMKLDW